MKRIPFWLSLAFVLLLLVPLLRRPLHLFPRLRLYGVEAAAEAPVLTARTWFDGTFQKRAEQRFDAWDPLRAYLVRTRNQIDYALFGTVHRSSVVVGKDNVLFEKCYIDSYNEPDSARDEDLDTLADRLVRLQALLQDRRIGFLVVIAPSKVTVYPEKVPDGQLVSLTHRPPCVYDRLRPLLDRRGVHCLDARALFLSRRADAPCPLFPRGGTHWSYYGAGLVLQQIVELLGRQTGRDYPSLRLVRIDPTHEAYREENDLGDLLNLWTRQRMMGIQYRPTFERVADGQAVAGRWLFVGDSFVHTLTALADRCGIVQQADSFYYFKRRFSYPGEAESKLDVERLDLKQEILARDAVILELNESLLPDIGFGFVDAAIAALAR